MPPLEEIAAFITDKPVVAGLIGVLGLLALAIAALLTRLAWRAAVTLFRRYVQPRPVEDVLTIVAACIATGVSAQGMWRFSGDVLGLDGPLRLLLFAFIEVAIVTSAVRARRNMRENFSAGIDGVAVWALTCLTAVLSSMDARSVAEAVFRLAAPLVAAWLWERGMAIERHRIRGTGRINWRLTPERMLVRLGLAEVSDRTATEVDVHRRLTRVALAAKRAKTLREQGAPERKVRAALAKLDKAMDQAVEHTGLAVDPARQEALLAQIAALYNTEALIDADPRVPWAPKADHTPVPARELPPALAELVQEDDEEVEVLDTTPQVLDTAERARLMREARRYWDRQIAKRIVPRTVDIAQEVGVSVAMAREWRALWKLEPKAHALIEQLYQEHGIVDTGAFPAIAVHSGA
ncbi:hypothetical protein [Thermoactinospora rubra]|uniref:hypothetical protein n=1 Tax=Thermoactinospora rubra TaxID=1088767 RepID=UPI000A10C65E|nr:hypothetical protein [Thermoactinospora rubra]